MSRRACRLDENQQDVIDALTAIGCSVQSLSGVGSGCPDILCGTGGAGGFLVLMEVKNPAKPAADQALTNAQKKWHREWLGPAHVVYNASQAIGIISFYRGGRRAA